MAGRQGDHNYGKARPAAHRVLDRVVVDDNGCWIWPGCRYPSGYGCVGTGSRRDGDRRTRGTHVVLWEYFNGPVPAGLELDHLCRVRACCNPGHLEPVTHAVNMQRAPWGHLHDFRSTQFKEINEKRWAVAL